MRHTCNINGASERSHKEQLFFVGNVKGREFVLPITQISVRQRRLEQIKPVRAFSVGARSLMKGHFFPISNGSRQFQGIQIEECAQRGLSDRCGARVFQ